MPMLADAHISSFGYLWCFHCRFTPSRITMEIFFSNRYSFFNFMPINVKFELSSHYNKQEEQYKKLQFITNWLLNKVITITARKVLQYKVKVEISCQVFLHAEAVN